MKHLLTTAALSLTLGAGAAFAQTTLFFGEAGPNRGARAEAIQYFVDQVDEISGGDLTFDVQWGGALFKAGAARSGIADGIADAGTIIGVYFPQEMAAYGIADLPIDNPDPWVGMKATDELMRNNEAIQQNLADQNLVYIGTFTTSAVHIGCKGTSIASVADIAGKKVRGVGAYGKAFADSGANLVSMSIYDAYQGLDSGLIDCTQGYSYVVPALQWQEVIDSYTLMNWGQVGALGVFMNKDMFDSLSEEQQNVLMQAGESVPDELGRILSTDNDAAVEMMREQGIEIIELPEEERAKLVETGATYIDAWKETANGIGLDGEALLTEYRGLIDQYTAERDEQGYPWER
ncbi:2,3-diketo-L-gulonate-binding periplasmic protein YiaO precursor [Rhodobacteraceae bacterium THAF1]|uniref:C4-dicarboxylate TRAP transporter substrate-binding protein n=1 Tax=Palleronia sp. THAF1 TaxID=2587842 RepID=UPI000F3B262A|nr:C4-dicarboxylate TRAP transporter substrate-binding protein [Palleronia sp. THAF1]QFU08016.1 2,3-diketo-L-gulonate-binding periplasmic protein YiaO precursor [Palleronia sp. THAF1]VDC27869.1 2,3-diketo-L-gulonate-binding periplasmic protein YiaO precursor [Rhodobacteraceae bacterium THAF1]